VESPAEAMGWIMVAMSGTLYALARSTRFSPQVILNLGLLFEIAMCALLALNIPREHYSMALELDGVERLADLLPFTTWTTPIIILFPLIIPSPPAKTLWVAIAAAATTPLGVAVYEWAGVFNVEPRAYVHVSASPAIAVTVAYFGSRVVYGLGLDVKRAREMGSYHLADLLGRGGMGEVWKAEHRMLARPAAIKLVRPEMLGVSDETARITALKRFEREAQTTALLRSPHTIELYDFGVTADNTFYYVMELLDGYNLETLIKQFGPVPAERAIYLLQQMCHSLAEAHESDLIHRDIKPANVFACRYGRESDFVKLLDFGLVKVRAEPRGEDVKLTSGNFPGGTPAFMAPEQALDDTKVDAKTDIYAVGCVAYWLLTGKLVFEGETAMQVVTDHIHRLPTPLSQRTERKIPRELEAVIMSCLEKDPSHRPQSADALSKALAECETEARWTKERAGEWWDAHADRSL
jgi:tRNA A-37 threonylcarbamoyl transferase component Bud32